MEGGNASGSQDSSEYAPHRAVIGSQGKLNIGDPVIPIH